mgnify:CR=1 FL=1
MDASDLYGCGTTSRGLELGLPPPHLHLVRAWPPERPFILLSSPSPHVTPLCPPAPSSCCCLTAECHPSGERRRASVAFVTGREAAAGRCNAQMLLRCVRRQHCGRGAEDKAAASGRSSCCCCRAARRTAKGAGCNCKSAAAAAQAAAAQPRQRFGMPQPSCRVAAAQLPLSRA